MAERYIIRQNAPLTITAEDADRLLSLHSGDAALLYLYLLRNDGECDAKAAAALGVRTPYSECMAALQKVGLVKSVPQEAPPLPPAPEIPAYTAEEISRRSETDADFRVLITETGNRLGRLLSGADLKTLFGIYDYLGLPTDVILLLVSWCIQESKRKYGQGRLPTLHQIEKEAYLWARLELFSFELADKYLRTRQQRQTESALLAQSLGIRDRVPSPTEEKYLTAWLDMGFPQDVILRAYDKTVLKKGELTWPYMNRILENWHQKGLHTIAAIEAGDKPPQTRRSDSAQSGGPTQADMQRMQEYMNRLNGGGRNGT